MSNQDSGREELLLRLSRLQQETREIEKSLGLHGPDLRESPVPPEAETTLASLIGEYASDLVSVHTIQGHYLFASPSARVFFGIPPEKLIGRSAYDFYHHADVEQIAASHARHLSLQERDQTVRYRIEDDKGQLRWVETHTRVTPNGEMLVAITRLVGGPSEVGSDPGGSEKISIRKSADKLTNLPTRSVLEAEIERELDRSKRHGHQLSIAKFDVDRFTMIGDRVGQSEASRVLRNVSYLLRRNQRIYDTLGRWGEDEFLLVLPETPMERAEVAAERYRQSVEESRIVSEGTQVTISAGLASADRVNRIEDLIEQVETALITAKASGRNRVARFESH